MAAVGLEVPGLVVERSFAVSVDEAGFECWSGYGRSGGEEEAWFFLCLVLAEEFIPLEWFNS